jgi:hypothetical protein
MRQATYYSTFLVAIALLPGLTLGNELKSLGHDVVVEYQYKAPADAEDKRSWERVSTGVNGKDVATDNPDIVGAIQFSSVGDAASFSWSRDTECYHTREVRLALDYLYFADAQCDVYLSEYPGVDHLVWNIAESRVLDQGGLLASAVHVECSHIVSVPDAPERCWA